MDPFIFILQPEDTFYTYETTYTSNNEVIKIDKSDCNPPNYSFHRHTPEHWPKYILGGVKIEESRGLLDFDIEFPVHGVEEFRVYYKELDQKTPLLICMQIEGVDNIKRFRYFCPRDKNKRSWMAVQDLTVDFTSEQNQDKLKSRLRQIVSLLDGVEIEIEKTYNYTHKNIDIKVHKHEIGQYHVYTHQLEPHEPFHLKKIYFEFKPLTLDKLTSEQVISVNVFGMKKGGPLKPIAIRVDKYVKETSDDVKNYDWYCLYDRKTNKWVKEERFAPLYDEESIAKHLDKEFLNVYDLDIELKKEMFNDPDGQEVINNGLRGTFMMHKNSKSKFTKYIYSLDIARRHVIKSFKIDGTYQINLPNELYSDLYVFCHEKNDKGVPVLLCFELQLNSYKWYRPEYYLSNKWVECYDLSSCDPKYNVNEHLLEKCYLILFWITLDIEKTKAFDTNPYSSNKRILVSKKHDRENYQVFEIRNQDKSYPFYARIYRHDQPISEIDCKEEIYAVYVLYYNVTLEPLFVVFEPTNQLRSFYWYAKDFPNYDMWYLERRLFNKDPKDTDFGLLTPYDLVFYYDEKNLQRMTEQKSIGIQAVGASAATAACCGAGYLLYTNASHITELFTSLFH